MTDAFRAQAVTTIATNSTRVYRLLDTSVRVGLRGALIQVPVSHGIGVRNLSFQQHEAEFVGLLGTLLSLRAGTVVDVGANIGRFLMYIVAADKGRQYVGFEPLLAACSYVEKLIALNRLGSHTVIPAALSDQVGVIRLWHNTIADVCASTTPGFYGDSYYRKSSAVACVTGDAALQALDSGPVGLIKVDVEGGELEALRGFANTIAQNRPCLVVEVIPPLCKDPEPELIDRRRDRIAALQKLLESWEFEIYKITDGHRLIRRSGQLDPGLSLDVKEMDYLCVPRELAHEVEARTQVVSM